MIRMGSLQLIFILLISLLFRLVVNYFIPITQQINLFVIFIGMVNLILVFIIIRRLINFKVGLLSSLLYAISPWTAYLEIAANPYIFLLTFLLLFFLGAQVFSINKKIYLLLTLLVIVVYIQIYNQFTVFSNIGLLNSVNEYRGETNQSVFAPIGKIIENKYIYFSEHVLFNVLKQFTPSTYFSNQAHLLGFSFSPPIYLGFIIPFMFGLIKLIKFFPKNRKYHLLPFFFLLLPSILSKNSPDLSRLVLIAPIVFAIVASGIWELILNYKRKKYAFLLLLTIFIVGIQFAITLVDIAIREPIRLQMFLGQK